MLLELTTEQASWVEETIKSMNMEQLVGMLLCPEDRKYSKEDWLNLINKVPIGNIFYGSGDFATYTETLQAIQTKSIIPVTVAVDMEQGVNLDDYGTIILEEMGIGATNDEQAAYELGRIVAKEARALGAHWTYAPVVDINLNFNNPVTNIRSFGDDANKVAGMLRAAVKGRQADCLLAATAKHFPGDGVDDRDQHLCTSVNSLPMEQWRELFGKVWKAAIDDAGVMSIMSGHISLPAYQGYELNPEDALPATLCSKLQIDLLRNELGFKGVLVSDAAPMIGITSRVASEDIVVENIVNGSDVFLFANPLKDFERLMNAVKSGRLTEERVYESARRVLEMKARLNIHKNPFGEKITTEVFHNHRKKTQKAADSSITLIKNNGKVPVSLKKGAKVLTVTLTYEGHNRKPQDLDVIDEELKERGFEVEHLVNPGHNPLIKKAKDYDMIFFNMYVIMHMKAGTIRATDKAILSLWRAFYSDNANVIFSSFGNPYVLYEQPHLPNMVLTYGASDASQRAAVKVWLGEIEAKGILPVREPKVKIKEFKV